VPAVRLLDGGIQSWTAKNYALKTGMATRAKEKVSYAYSINTKVSINAAEIRKAPESYQLIDNRSLFEWIRGRIPGAVHISWEKFFSGNQNKPLSRSELISLFRKKSVNPDEPIVYYCTGGVRSAYAWMVHTLAGLPAANFEGGMAEWEHANR